jgi:hypothetical protein
MKYYEYDLDGWLIGWYDDDERPNSTTEDFAPISPRFARWNGSAWVSDNSKRDAMEQAKITEQTEYEQIIAFLRAYDENTATATEVRVAVGAILTLLQRLIKELKP